MKTRLCFMPIIFIAAFLTGCDSLRLSPDETQKYNAYLHTRTSEMAALLAEQEGVSQPLQKLTNLSSKQSKAFLAYYGLPSTLPESESIEDLTAPANIDLAEQAIQAASERVDYMEVADNALNIGIAVASMLGGAFGLKLTSVLISARQNTHALKEIIQANEVFKQKHPESADLFKQAQSSQSNTTRKIVANVKSEA